MPIVQAIVMLTVFVDLGCPYNVEMSPNVSVGSEHAGWRRLCSRCAVRSPIAGSLTAGLRDTVPIAHEGRSGTEQGNTLPFSLSMGDRRRW